MGTEWSRRAKQEWLSMMFSRAREPISKEKLGSLFVLRFASSWRTFNEFIKAFRVSGEIEVEHGEIIVKKDNGK